MLLVALWPPWYYDIDPDGADPRREIRFGFLLAPPAPVHHGAAAEAPPPFGYRVAWEIQVVLWFLIAGLSIGAVLALRDRRGRIHGAKKRRSARDGDIRSGRQ